MRRFLETVLSSKKKLGQRGGKKKGKECTPPIPIKYRIYYSIRYNGEYWVLPDEPNQIHEFHREKDGQAKRYYREFVQFMERLKFRGVKYDWQGMDRVDQKEHTTEII